VIAAALFGAMALAQIAIPLTDDRSTLTTAVVVLFAGVTTALVGRGALVALPIVLAIGWGVEELGSSTGFPFGEYDYGDDLQPQLAGVPLAVVLAWWAMAVPAREVARRLVPGRWVVPVGAVALTAWDVFLDPQMVGEGYWTWLDGGPWRDIPLTNYVGWLVVGCVVMLVLERWLPRVDEPAWLVALYAWWAVMQTVGFVFFFDDVVVGLVGGLCMLPLAGLALRRG